MNLNKKSLQCVKEKLNTSTTGSEIMLHIHEQRTRNMKISTSLCIPRLDFVFCLAPCFLASSDESLSLDFRLTFPPATPVDCFGFFCCFSKRNDNTTFTIRLI